jgi:hypothetical protein
VKAGKEEIMGLVAAVEQWVLVRDHPAEVRRALPLSYPSIP